MITLSHNSSLVDEDAHSSAKFTTTTISPGPSVRNTQSPQPTNANFISLRESRHVSLVVSRFQSMFAHLRHEYTQMARKGNFEHLPALVETVLQQAPDGVDFATRVLKRTERGGRAPHPELSMKLVGGMTASQSTMSKDPSPTLFGPTHSPGSLTVQHSHKGLYRGDGSFHSAGSTIPELVPETSDVAFENDEIGNKIMNQYCFVEGLGQGAYGKVKLAIDMKTSQHVAVKVLNLQRLRRVTLKDSSGNDRTAVDAVRQEIAIMKKISHKNVVRLREVLENRKTSKLYMVMQYIDGGPIVDLQSDGTCVTVPEDRAKMLFRSVVSGLAYLHRNNIIHRDIKPDNILVDAKTDTPYITDFGVSEVTSAEGGDRIGPEERGTVAFFSPEVCRGETLVHGKAVDVWALGVTLYACCFGKLPFVIPDHHPASKDFPGFASQLAYNAYRNEIQNAAITFPPNAPPVLRELLVLMLNKDPVARITAVQLKKHPWFGLSNTEAQKQDAELKSFKAFDDWDESIQLTDDDMRSAVVTTTCAMKDDDEDEEENNQIRRLSTIEVMSMPSGEFSHDSKRSSLASQPMSRHSSEATQQSGSGNSIHTGHPLAKRKATGSTSGSSLTESSDHPQMNRTNTLAPLTPGESSIQLGVVPATPVASGLVDTKVFQPSSHDASSNTVGNTKDDLSVDTDRSVLSSPKNQSVSEYPEESKVPRDGPKSGYTLADRRRGEQREQRTGASATPPGRSPSTSPRAQVSPRTGFVARIRGTVGDSPPMVPIEDAKSPPSGPTPPCNPPPRNPSRSSPPSASITTLPCIDDVPAGSPSAGGDSPRLGLTSDGRRQSSYGSSGSTGPGVASEHLINSVDHLEVASATSVEAEA